MEQDKIWAYLQTKNASLFDWSQGRLKFLAHQIKGEKYIKPKVLNIGVGNGAFEKVALSFDFDIYSLDPSQETITNLIDNLNLNHKAKVGYSQNIPFDNNFFDFVVVSEVLEHLSDDVLEKSLIEFYRILKDQGYLIGTVPSREPLERSVVVCPKCGEVFHRWGHVQSFTKSAMSNLLSKHFCVEKIIEKYFWSTLNWKGKAVAALKLTLQFFFRIPAYDQFLYFYAQKK